MADMGVVIAFITTIETTSIKFVRYCNTVFSLHLYSLRTKNGALETRAPFCELVCDGLAIPNNFLVGEAGANRLYLRGKLDRRGNAIPGLRVISLLVDFLGNDANAEVLRLPRPTNQALDRGDVDGLAILATLGVVDDGQNLGRSDHDARVILRGIPRRLDDGAERVVDARTPRAGLAREGLVTVGNSEGREVERHGGLFLLVGSASVAPYSLYRQVLGSSC